MGGRAQTITIADDPRRDWLAVGRLIHIRFAPYAEAKRRILTKLDAFGEVKRKASLANITAG
jgi:hypothetical protein